MKKNFISLAFTCAFLFPLSAMAQEHYTERSVSRVLLLAVTPGKMNAFLGDLAENLKPVLDDEKQQGLISSYQVSLNTTKETPEDWDVAIAIQYKNMAALDGLTAKTDALSLKHYGSKEARQSATDRRVELAHLVGSRLTRQITLKQRL